MEGIIAMEKEDLVEKFNDWLQQNHWSLPNCPISRKANWVLAEHIVEFHPYTGSGLVVGGSVYPVLMLICQDCGYTMFINAAIVGLA